MGPGLATGSTHCWIIPGSMPRMSSLAATQKRARHVSRLPSCKCARCALKEMALSVVMSLGLVFLCPHREAACQSYTQESLIRWECLQPGKGGSCRQPGKLVLPGEVSVSIEAGLKEKELVEALQPLKDERLLLFTDMRQAFGGFSNAKDAERCAPHMVHLHRISSRTVWC